MALILHNAGVQPLGQFDCLDSQRTTFKGGEVCTLVGVLNVASTDQAAADVFNDGYVGTTTKNRPAVTFTLSNASRPLFLADDGVAGYGTIFGQVVGGNTGQSTGGSSLGPHTSTGSGKMTIWDKPGLYGTSLDAVDTAADGLIPANATLTVGTQITYTATGKLTPVGSTAAVSGAPTVARLASFETNGSMVSTPSNLVASLNSPSGVISSTRQLQFSQVVYWFGGAGV